MTDQPHRLHGPEIGHARDIIISDELLTELADWSAPCQIRITTRPGMPLEFEARTHTCHDPLNQVRP